jgi:Autographiviridae endonuclease
MGRPKLQFDEQYEPVTESGCWIWMACLDADGYGFFSAAPRGTPKRAHRFAYARLHGPIPPGLCVCHRCDVPSCVNPSHLFLGTPRVNNDDKIRKGRQIHGVQVNTAKLSEAQVREIRATAGTLMEVATQYGVTDVLVSLIRRRKIWKHVQ